MKAAVVKMLGQPPIYGDFEDPQPVAGETRIAVAAASLSPLARARASGAHYSADIALPFIAGVDGVGRRDDGQRVYFLLPRAPFGAMAEWTVVPQALTLPVPDEIGDEQAAAIANPGMSSWAALVERAHVRGGETVLINGATGASGQLAIGIARHFGASRIIATGRNRTILDDLEADSVIPLNQPEAELGAAFAVCFADGVDIVLDYLWGPSARILLAAGAKSGHGGKPIRFVQIGSAAGEEIALAASILRSSTIEMVGSGLGSVSLDRILPAIEGVFGLAAAGNLSLGFHALPLADVGASWNRKDRRIVYATGSTVG